MKKNQVAFLFVLLIAIFGYLFYKQALLPVDKNDQNTKIFVVNQGDSLQTISDDLEKNNLIRSKVVFYLMVRLSGLGHEIQAGDFRLSPSMDAYEIAKDLTHGTMDVWVTLIEGTRKEEMAQVISKQLDIPEIEFVKEAQEGYMFPDTYLIPKDATVGSVILMLKNNFSKKFTADLANKAAGKGLTEKQTVILASIVEREARHVKDKNLVASILLKRLKNDMPLQVDSTIEYALGYQVDEKNWWKKELSLVDLKIDSPYNTYTNTGLPPTPICSPGLDSIKAVANADPSTPYWYYLSDKQGNMHYSTTLEEHNANVKKYLQ
ncbi:endolytic transglycosylase MltG [Patescibacteria group bacterium]|nr:endolytic transglycosylase MltG [Patescibacteria group bacterium]